MVLLFIFNGTPSQSSESVPTRSTSFSSTNRLKTSGVTREGIPVLKTYSVSPLPGV